MRSRATVRSWARPTPPMRRGATIRKDFGELVEANSVHGSDGPETAAAEIAFFFGVVDIVG